MNRTGFDQAFRRYRPRWVPLWVLFALWTAPACKDARKPETSEESAQAGAQRSAEATTSTTPTAQAIESACVEPFQKEGPPETIDAWGRTFQRIGSTLALQGGATPTETVLGVMADIKEDTSQNLKNIDAILDFFRRERAEAIVVAGDIGESQTQIQNVLGRLAKAKLPVFAVIGNREGKRDFQAALAQIAATESGVFSLNQSRLVLFESIALVSLPGYYNREYIHASDGCQYTKADVEAIKDIVPMAAERTIVLVSHGPPRQEGPEALDRTLEQANVGDPQLAQLLRETGIRFGIFANIHESGGRATNLVGTQLIPQGKMSNELYLNPGPSDSVRWTMNDRTESTGMAAIMTFKDGMASFKSYRVASTLK